MNRQDARDAKSHEPDADLDQLAAATLAACIDVHRALGPGFLESMYEAALCIELQLRGIPYQRQLPIGLTYKGHDIGRQQLDLVVGERLIVELKAVDALAPIHTAQLLSYLKVTGLTLGLLINFNTLVLLRGVRRVILSQ